MHERKKNKVRLDEVTLMRAILAILIVFMHSFTCYNGSWKPPASFVDIPAYKWLTRISFAFALEGFVFISGYILGFQCITLKRNKFIMEGFFLVDKLKRLIIPSIIFSICYFLIFFQYHGIGNFCYSILNGCGHLWYLPMLFWCFVLEWIFMYFKADDIWKFIFWVAVNLLVCIILPLRISNSMTYMVYFHGGFLCYKYSSKIQVYKSFKDIILFWIIFILLFIIFRPMREVFVYRAENLHFIKLCIAVGNHACQLIYAWAGIIAFYCSVIFVSRKHKISDFIQKIATCSFGIYIFQQFILQFLYYKTAFPMIVGPYWLPWFGFVIATVISFIFSTLLLRFRVGRFLIG